MLTSKVHGYLDYTTALFFLIAPSLFAFSEAGTLLAYTLGIIHLLMTLLTGFSVSLIKLIPFHLHGRVELIVAVVLIAAPWLLADFFSGTDRIFYTICGAAIFGVWLLSSYENPLDD